MSFSSESEHALWKRLIDMGIFDDFYPLRLNACFRYLDVEKTQSFSLKDWTQKGLFIFSYLSLNINQESLPIMEAFRSFNRSGSGAVNIEEFVIGMVENLFTLYKNSAVLGSIADEVLAVENRSSELATRLEKEATQSDKFVQFRSNLMSLLYLIRDKLRNPPKNANYAVNLTPDLLISLFQECILQAMQDSLSYFHISNERISGIFMEYETYIQLVAAQTGSDHAGTKSLAHFADAVWNLEGPRLFSTGTLLGSAAEAAAVGLLPSYDASGGDGGAGPLGTTATGGSASVSGGGPRPSSPGLSDGEEESPLFNKPDAQAAVGAASRGGRKKSILALNDPQAVYDALQPTANLVSLGLEAEALEALSGLATNNGSIDSSQLYLLQAAFRSLESFFTLADTPSSPATTGDAAKVPKTQKEEFNAAASAIAKTTELRKNAEYLSAEGEVPKDQLVPILATGFEFDLAQSLLEAQEALRKTRMRMDVLEMVQEEAMKGENSVYIEDDEDSDEANARTALDRDFSAEAAEDTHPGDGHVQIKDKRGVASEELAIIEEVDRKYGHKATSFDGIMNELSALRACLSERATVDYPLGHLLDRNVAIFALEDSTDERSYKSGLDFEDAPKALPPVLKSMGDTTKDLIEIVRLKTQASSASQAVVSTLKQHEEKLAEFRTNNEQVEVARNEFTSLTVELQILREKIARHNKDEGQLSKLQERNLELSRHLRELEELPGDPKSKRSKESAADSKSESKKIHDLRTLTQQLELQKSSLQSDMEKLQKENVRLRGAMAISEQRVKGALQDQMSLHHQLQQLEEDNMNAKATITKLTREMEDHKIGRGHREDADRRISELQREIHKRDVELAEAREEASQAIKYQTDLTTAESMIEQLERKVGEDSVELEKGAVAMLQLDSYREQLRLKTKENRDMSLHIHGLENQLKDVPYLQTRYAEVQEELEDCKMKIEKLPGLLSEQARLRGSSRASVKALQEHDKTLNHYKTRVKQLERETAILKNDNRAMQELEVKLKESNQEIKRLLTVVAEGGNPNKTSGASSATGSGPGMNLRLPNAAEDEKQRRANASDGQYRKMRSRIRQSIAVSGATGSAGMAAAVAATLNHT